MKLGLGILLLSLSILGGHLNADTLPKVRFLNFAQCNVDQDYNEACRWISGSFEPWTNERIKTVEEAMAASHNPKADRFFQLLQTLGLKEINFIYASGSAAQAETLVSYGVAFIVLHPSYFASNAKYGDVTEQTHAFIHELFHVYAYFQLGNDYYADPYWHALATALEWHEPRNLNPFVSGKSYEDLVKKYNSFRKAGQANQSIALDIAYSRPKGFPSIYGMTQIAEYFPEVGSFLIHDPQMVTALPAGVVALYKTTDLAFLVADAPATAPIHKNESRFTSQTAQNEFVGMLFDQDHFACTVFLIKDGVAGTAQHCINPAWIKSAGPQEYSYLSMQFPKADGSRVTVYGSAITAIFKDSGKNDLAYIVYDPAATKGLVQIPILHFMRDQNEYSQANTTLYSLGFPLGTKIQKLERVQTTGCAWDGQVREMADSPFQGLLYGTTCPGWYGASGAPLLSAGDEPGHLNLWGVLSHTFATVNQDSVTDIQADSWGPYTNTNFSPIYLGREFLGLEDNSGAVF